MKQEPVKVYFTINGISQAPVILYAANDKGIQIIMNKHFSNYKITRKSRILKS
jgi:flagellar assembly factor FliW